MLRKKPTFAQRLCAGGISLAGPSLKRAGSPQSASMSGLVLRLTTDTQTHKSVTMQKCNCLVDL